MAKAAGFILAAQFPPDANVIITWACRGRVREVTLRARDLNSICASALTQAEDKPKRRKPGALTPEQEAWWRQNIFSNKRPANFGRSKFGRNTKMGKALYTKPKPRRRARRK